MTLYNLNPAATPTNQQAQIDLETQIRDAIGQQAASPAANTLQSRMQSVVDNTSGLSSRIGDAVASPAANTLMARLQALLDTFGSGASPAANTLQSRIGSIDNDLGNPGDAVAASDTANAGVIPLLKRIAQRLGNVEGNTWAASRTSTYTSMSQVSVGTANTAILASNGQRRGFILYNSGTNTVFISLGSPATTAAYSIPLPGGFAYIDDSSYQGTINGITSWGSSTIMATSLLA